MVWCSFMKSKADSAESLMVFKAKVEKHSGERMMSFRCDYGNAEYDNKRPWKSGIMALEQVFLI